MERKCCAGGENNSSERGGGALSVDQAFLGAKRLRLLTRQTKGSVSQLHRKFSRSRAAKACREPCNETPRKAVESSGRAAANSCGVGAAQEVRTGSLPAAL